jgi:hypothetical protein
MKIKKDRDKVKGAGVARRTSEFYLFLIQPLILTKLDDTNEKHHAVMDDNSAANTRTDFCMRARHQ